MRKAQEYTSIFDAPVSGHEEKPRKNKKVTALVAVALAVCILGVAAFAAVKYLPKEAEMTDEGSAVVSISEDDITEITCTFEGETVGLIKEGESWLCGDIDVTENTAAGALIGRCAKVMSLKTMAESDADYGFSDPYGTVSVKADSGNYTITFGNTISDGYSRYFKVSGTGDDNVYLMLITVVDEYDVSAADFEEAEETEESAGTESEESTQGTAA